MEIFSHAGCDVVFSGSLGGLIILGGLARKVAVSLGF